MAAMNNSGEDIRVKVVYYGPGSSGKTSNLDYLYANAPARAKGKVITTTTRTDRTIFFDFVPLEFGEIEGCHTRFVLYTVPGQVYYNATRKLVLDRVDAIVFVADSAGDKLQENVECLRNLEENLNEYGLSLDHVPWVIQYNKRDLPDVVPVKKLHEHLNLLNVPAFEAVASEGKGVYETFNSVAALVRSRLLKEFESAGFTVAREAGSSARQAAETQVQEAPPGAREADQEGDLSDVVEAAFREIGTDEKNAAGASDATRPQPEVVSPAVDEAGLPPEQAPFDTPHPEKTAEAPEKSETQEQGKDLWAQSVGSATDAPVQEDRPAQPPASAPEFSAPEAEELHRAVPISDEIPDTSEVHEVLDPGARRTPVGSEPQPAVDADDGDTFSFESAIDDGMAADVGRLVELDEMAEVSDADRSEEAPEFITDPMRPVVTLEKDGKKSQVLEMQMPRSEERSVEPREELHVTVPVVISRSQVRKTMPLKLILEIQIVDD